MRWAAFAIVVATASTADARMVRRRDPPVVEACRTRKDWAAVTTCLDTLGSFQIERTLERARLVHVWLDDPAGGKPQDAGVYLFVQQPNATWAIGGMFVRGMNDTVLGLSTVTLDGHLGYKLDVATLLRMPLSLGDAPPIPGTIRLRSSLYCYGNSFRCVEMQTDCEVMSRGKTLLAFHGTTRFDRGDLTVEGDVSHAGAVCGSPQHESLGWRTDAP